MGSKTLMTVEQFAQLPEDGVRQFELAQGELVEVGNTTFLHNWIRDRILLRLGIFLTQSRLGEVQAEALIRLDSNTVYMPDGAFWDSNRLATMQWRVVPIETIPQLVWEVF